MEDFLIAILIGWVLLRLLRPVVFVQWGGRQQTHPHNPYPPQREGEIKVTQTQSRNKSQSDSGEYVDFEEIPNEKKN